MKGTDQRSHHSFALAFSDTREMGAAKLTCSGICSCAPTSLYGREKPKPNDRRCTWCGPDKTSLHHVENVVLQPRFPSLGTRLQGFGRKHAGSRGGLNAASSFESRLRSTHHARRRAVASMLQSRDAEDGSRSRYNSTSLSNSSGCCVVSIQTTPIAELPPQHAKSVGETTSATDHAEGSSFKVLSYFVGKGAAGTGWVHQQSIELASTT